MKKNINLVNEIRQVKRQALDDILSKIMLRIEFIREREHRCLPMEREQSAYAFLVAEKEQLQKVLLMILKMREKI